MGLEKINAIRKEKGITIEDLSERSGVPLSTLKKICAGITTNPNIETVKAIVRALGCRLDDLDEPKEKAPASMQELSRELTLLIKWFSKASAHDQASILRFAELAAAASQRSVDLSPEERARVVLREMALQDSVSASEVQER